MTLPRSLTRWRSDRSGNSPNGGMPKTGLTRHRRGGFGVPRTETGASSPDRAQGAQGARPLATQNAGIWAAFFMIQFRPTCAPIGLADACRAKPKADRLLGYWPGGFVGTQLPAGHL